MERLEMSDTPRTDEVLRIADNWGAIRDAAGGVMDGVLPEEAHADMVTALERLARTLERELAEARGEIAGGAHDSANYPDSPVARLKAALDFVCENEGELHGRNYLALVKLLNPSPARRVEPGCGLDCSCRWPTDEKPGFSGPGGLRCYGEAGCIRATACMDTGTCAMNPSLQRGGSDA
jgi:hypothetical protein